MLLHRFGRSPPGGSRLRMTPFDGLAFFTSAISLIGPPAARRELKGSRRGWPQSAQCCERTLPRRLRSAFGLLDLVSTRLGARRSCQDICMRHGFATAAPVDPKASRACVGSLASVSSRSVFEVPAAGEDHRQAVLVAGGDHFVVLARAARLDDGRRCRPRRPGGSSRGRGRRRRRPARSRRPRSPALRMAISTESTRLICPAPAPHSIRSLQSTMALDLTCRTIAQANRRSAQLRLVGCGSVTTFHSSSGSGRRRPLAPACRRRCSGSAQRRRGRPERPTSISRTLCLPLGLGGEDLQGRRRRSPGPRSPRRTGPAWPGTSAVAASTVRLKPRTEPNALTGSPAMALRVASASVAADAAPQGLLCLITDGGRLGQRADDGQRAVQVQQVVVRQFLAVELAGR